MLLPWGGVDVILFTGGVGENQSQCREAVCDGLQFIGVELDKEMNNKIHGDELSSLPPNQKSR